MEYATRDQAQNAVNTLSNQSLMGRLVYVREVFGLDLNFFDDCLDTMARTANPNLDLLVHLSVVTSVVPGVPHEGALVAEVTAEADSFTCRTFVPLNQCFVFIELI